jgi:hypothetical protein
MASAATLQCSACTWTYTSLVTRSDEWTNVSLITFMGTPMANSSEPAEWRSSCVVQAPSPALEPTRAKWRLKLFGSIAVPIGVVKTRPAPAH